MAHTLTKPAGMKMKDDVWRNLDKNVAEAFISMHDQIKTLRSQTSSMPTSQPLDLSKDGGIMDDMTTLQNRTKLLEESIINLQGTLGSFAFDDSFQRGMKDSITAMDEFMGSAEAGKKAYESLAKNLRGFQQLNSDTVQGVTDVVTTQSVKLTSALSNQAAVLNQLGLSYGEFTKGIDSAIYSFGLNADQVQKFNFQIKDMADTLKMVPQEVASNFNKLTKTMAYDLETIRGQFLRFQKLSLQTGVGFDTLTSKFGANMDTISGASSAAANINMLLGKNVFSATQILTMPDAERAEAMREAIMSDQSIMADIDRGGATGKFALQTVAENMNMSVDEARRFITTGEKPDPVTGKGGSVKNQISKELESQLGSTTENFKTLRKGVVDLTKAFNAAQEEILLRVSPNRRALILARQQKLKDTREGEIDTNLFQDLGQNFDLGIMPAGLENQDVAKALFRGGTVDRNVVRVIQGLQSGLIDEDSETLKNLFANLTTTKDQVNEDGRVIKTAAQIRADAQGQLSALREESDKSTKLVDILKKLGPGARSGFALVENNSPFAARVVAKRLIELDNSEDAGAKTSLSEIGNSLIGINDKRNEAGGTSNEALKALGKSMGDDDKNQEFFDLTIKGEDKFVATRAELDAFKTRQAKQSPNAGVKVTTEEVNREKKMSANTSTVKRKGRNDVGESQFGSGQSIIMNIRSATFNGKNIGPVNVKADLESVKPDR